jgi:hypothetical protein
MAFKQLFVALSVIGAAMPASASQPEPEMTVERAPEASPDARYCLRAEPLPGTRITTIACLTREEWAEGEVDVDEVWAEDGVKVVES